MSGGEEFFTPVTVFVMKKFSEQLKYFDDRKREKNMLTCCE